MGQSGEAGNWRMTRVTARNSIIVIVIIFIIVIIDHCHHICSHYHHHHPNSSNRSNLSGLKAHRPILFPGWSKAFMCSLPGFDNDHSPTRVSSLCFALQWECGVTQVAGTSHHHHHHHHHHPNTGAGTSQPRCQHRFRLSKTRLTIVRFYQGAG